MPGNDIPQIRVVVRLPYSRPENPPDEPPSIAWTPEKADVLWKVIEKSRARDNVKTDWKSLAERLDVPLPYLLYRVHARFQEELRGLSNIPGIVTPSTSPSAGKEEFPFVDGPQTVAGRAASRMAGSIRLSGSGGRNSTPLGIRARLSSLGANSPRPKRASSSSTLTLQGGPGLRSALPLRPPTPSSSEDSTDSEEEEMNREEEADRRTEEQANLDKQLLDLQRRMSADALGLVSKKGKGVDRGRAGLISPLSIGVPTFSNRSGSQSLSSMSSPRGSIPDIPSPPSESQPQSPSRRQMSPTHSVSPPPATSSRTALGRSNRRYTHLDGWSAAASEQGSSHGSRASSSGFSDLASDASVSASDLASALESNIRGTRFSAFARSRLHR